MRLNIRIIATILLLFSKSFLSAAPMQGEITYIIQVAPGYTENGQSFWFADSQSYTEGGVTFTWPDFFTGTPTVVVSVSSDSYSSAGQVVPIVVNNDQSGCTVLVNVATLTNIGEAQTDSFMVHIYAVQDGF